MSKFNDSLKIASDKLQVLSAEEYARKEGQQPIRLTINQLIQEFTAHVKPGVYLLQSRESNSSDDNAVRVDEHGHDHADVVPQEHAVSDDEDTEMLYDEEEDLIRMHREHMVIVNGTAIPINQYLGIEYTAHIKKLHNPLPTQSSPGLMTELHPYQADGVSKLIELGNGPYHGGILGDPMGLGKTLMCIEACLRDRKPGWPDLIITTKSCAIQWQREMEKHYDADQKPRSIILDDPRATANSLVAEQYQFVIVTYHFVMARWREYEKYEAFFSELVQKVGSIKAALEACEAPEFKHLAPAHAYNRLSNAIFSPVFEDLGIWWHHLILDEASIIKNARSVTHNAVRAVRAAKVYMATATFLDNRWYDVFGMTRQLPGVHPFDDRRLFDRAFAEKINGVYQNPSRSKRNRLAKWLQAFTICRPDSVLILPPMRIRWWNFKLSIEDELDVAVHTSKFLYALRMNSIELNQETGAQVRDSPSAALKHAMRAQQYCSNKELITKDERIKQEAQLKEARQEIQRFMLEWSMKNNADPGPSNADIHGEDGCKATDERLVDNRISSILNHWALDTAVRVDEPDTAAGSSTVHGDAPEKDPKTGDVTMADAIDDQEQREEKDEELVLLEEPGGAGDKETTFRDTEIGFADTKKRRRWLKDVQAMNDSQIFSTKITEVLQCLRFIVESDSGDIVIFTTFLMLHDLLHEAIHRSPWVSDNKVEVIRFDGTVTTTQERMQRTARFGTRTNHTKVMLITPGAGGYGLELSSAQHVLQLEPWWNHNSEKQAWGRVHRQGNPNPITVWRFSAWNSLIDSLFINIASKKTMVNESIMKYLRVSPGEQPKIPKQFSGSIGEY